VPRAYLSVVIAGLDPAIHGEARQAMKVEGLSGRHFIIDARVKPAHDAGEFVALG
jgi:hypothetical protein